LPTTRRGARAIAPSDAGSRSPILSAVFSNAWLPDFALAAEHRVGATLRALGIERFVDAARFVHALPYGRNADRADYALVVEERRGTCSTKHALLAALAREHGVALALRVGIYAMTEANTPGIGHALRAHGVESVPEAHCYLVHGDLRVDLTHPGTSGLCALAFEEEHPIEPEDIGERKLAIHRAKLARWAAARGLSFDEAWRTREECIAALSVSHGERDEGARPPPQAQ
jgi:hypothetical protein